MGFRGARRAAPPDGPALLVASHGGHLTELVLLARRITQTGTPTWVTFDSDHARSILDGEDVRWVPEVRPRDWRGTLAAFTRARRILSATKPAVVISTGAAIAVPYLTLAALRGIPAHFVESAARTDGPSLTGRLVHLVPPVQVHAQSRSFPAGWSFVGSVFDAFQPEEATDPRPSTRVLVTLGTSPFPFDRLVRRLSEVLPEDAEVIWQLGASADPGRDGDVVHRHLPWARLAEEVARADVVVTHAGVGSVLMALEAGRMPIVVPRRARFREHVDDHQAQIARMLSDRGLVLDREAGDIEEAHLSTASTTRVTTTAVTEPLRL